MTDTDLPSYWLETEGRPTRAPLETDERADVAIVGAGIVGITAAYLLAKAGKRVVVVDRHDLATRDTGRTTAHLTDLPDVSLSELARMHGDDGARKHVEALRHGMHLVQEIGREAGVDADHARVPGYLYAPRAEDVPKLEERVATWTRLGFAAEEARPDEVPFNAERVVRFDGQARFHPLKHMHALVERAEAMGARFHARSEAVDVDERDGAPLAVKLANGRRIEAEHVLLACHAPFIDKVRLWTRLYPFRSYVVAAPVPRGTLRDALYWDTLSPYHYTRIQPMPDGRDLVIFGGEDHHAGHAHDATQRWDRLEGTLRQALPADFEVTHRWSAQDWDTPDLLPLIGPNPGSSERVLVATGFAGQGMTWGAVAGWMMSERVLGRSTPWDEMLDPRRGVTGGRDTFWKEVAHVGKMYVDDYLKLKHKGPQLAELQPGQGAVVNHLAQKIAVAMDDEGKLHAVSAICRHMGCLVSWNGAEKSWDCGCHGSRYTIDGQVLEGPAAAPLPVQQVPEVSRARPRERAP